MSDANTSNTSEDSVNTPQEQGTLTTTLLRDFAKEKIQDKDSRASFVTDLRADGDITAERLAEIERFARDNPKYDSLEISTDTIKYSVLNREISSYFGTLANYKQELKNMIITDYDVQPAQLTAKGGKKIDELEEPELLKLIDSDARRKELLGQIYGPSNIPAQKTLASFFKEFDLPKKISLTPEAKKPDFIDAVEKIQKGEKLDSIDIETFLDSGVFTDVEQKKLLEKILPSMTLTKARELKFITDKEVRTFKEGLVKKIFQGDSIDARAVASEIPDDELMFSTETLLGDKEYREKIIDDPTIFIPFEKKYGGFIDSVNSQIDAKGIRKKEDFIKALALNPKVSGGEKLTKGSVIEIHQSQADETGKIEKLTMYAEITDMSDSGAFSIKERGSYNSSTKTGGYNTKDSEVSQMNYEEFIGFTKEGTPKKSISVSKVNVFSPEELKQKISEGTVVEGDSETLSLQDKSVLQAQVGTVVQQIESAERNIAIEKDRIREELQIARKAGSNSFSDAEIEEEIEKNEYIQNLYKDFEQLKSKRDQKILDLKNVDQDNQKTLEEKINELDETGKEYGLKRGVTFTTKQSIYTITHIDDITGGITVEGLGDSGTVGKWTVGFEEFFEIFKDQDAKRVSNSANFEGVFDSAQNDTDIGDTWKGFVLKDDKIRKKGAGENPTKSGVVYDYLVGSDNDQIVKIDEIAGDQVTVSFGKLEEKPKKVKNDHGEDEYVTDAKYVMYGGSSQQTFHTSHLDAFIQKYKLTPHSLNEKKEVADADGHAELNQNFHLLSFFFKNISIMEAVKGGQQFYEQIKEIMVQGQDEHALQFANMYLGKILPKGGRNELQVRLENSQKKRMEEYGERLRNVGSDVATDMIKGYLLDKHGPEYPKEAAVVFMLEKYGVLNAKKLADWQGDFKWYQALGGKINDELYNEIKAEVGEESLPFTEEYLVYRLIKKQCGPNGYKGIKRRSKLHKEIKKIRATGKEEERETGIRDGGDQRTLKGRVIGGMGELMSGNYPNAVGWLEQAVNKGGPMVDMNKMPFVMAFSGIAYDFEEKVTDDLKGFPAKSRVLMMLRFFSYHRDLDVLNGAIMKVSDILDARGGKYSGMAAKARKIFNNQRSGGTRSRIIEAEAFYEEYGNELTDIMYMLNTGKSGDNLNKLIFFEKDKPGNQILQKYYSNLHEFIDADTSFEDEGLMSDPFKLAGTSGMDINRVTKQLLGMRQGGSFTKHTAGPLMAEEIIQEFEAIPQRTYSDDPTENKAMQKQLLKDNLRRMIAGFLELHGADPSRALPGYNAPSSPFQKFNKWGVYLYDFAELEGGANYEDLLHGHDEEKYGPLLEKFADQIIKSETQGATYFRKDKYSDKAETAKTVGDSVSSIVSPSGKKDIKGNEPGPEDDWGDF